MNPMLLYKILFSQLASGRDVSIGVKGISMNPTLYEGDTVTVKKSSEYSIGDIVVFIYKGELLIHRLIKIENGRYFCKGDNSFRLEDMSPESIAGKVLLHNDAPLKDTPSHLPALSYLVNRTFRKCGYDAEKTKESAIYRFYYKNLWKVEDNTMNYVKNTEMDYIAADETSLAVFDPESGNTHFFDETGIDILNCLNEPCDIDTLLAKLCEIYDAPAEVIKPDVEEFLVELVAKKVILVQ